MAHRFTWDKLAKNAYRLNPKSRGHNYPYVPKFEIQSYTSGENRGQKVIVPFVGTKSILISLRAWGVTQASLHNITLLFSNVDIQTEDPHSNNYFQIQYDGKIYWIQKLDRFKHPLTSRCTCFTGDTKVLLADGTSKTFKELERQEFDVVCLNPYTKEFTIAHAGNCNIKKYKQQIIALHFNNGAIIKCTPDHKFFTENVQQEFAENLLNKKLLTNTSKDIYVVSIQDAGVEDVYCITIPEFANFGIDINGDTLFVENCADFFYTFAFYNAQVGHCLYGPVPKPYIRKTQNRPARNPQHLPGICKHIYHAWALLRNSGLTVN